MYTNVNMLRHEIMNNRDNNKTSTRFEAPLLCFVCVTVIFSIFLSFQTLKSLYSRNTNARTKRGVSKTATWYRLRNPADGEWDSVESDCK